MDNQSILKIIVTIGSIVGMIFLTGCSMNTSLVKDQAITVERVDSSSARITRAYLQPTETTVVLRGEVKRRLSKHGSIPGHLHVELIGSDGAVVNEADIDYRRKSLRSHYSTFHIAIPMELFPISIVRVTHHDPRSHMIDTIKSSWRDVSNPK